MAEHQVSLVIPARDEERSIGPLLDSVESQQVRPAEIIVVDGGSRDRTVEIVDEHIRKGAPIRIVRAGDLYPGKARNAGIESAKNSMVALADSGVVLNSSWLKELMKKMTEDDSVDVVFGVFEPRRDTLFKKYASIVFAPPKRIIDGKKMRTRSVASMLLKKKVWEDVGGFPDLRSAEDRIFIDNVMRSGCKVAYAPEAIVTWDVPAGPAELFAKFYLYSYHGIRAKKMSDWHIPVIRTYLILIFFAILGMVWSPVFLAVPIALLCARVFRLIWRKSEGDVSEKLNPVQFVYVFFGMLIVDLALFCGIVKYALSKYVMRVDDAS